MNTQLTINLSSSWVQWIALWHAVLAGLPAPMQIANGLPELNNDGAIAFYQVYVQATQLNIPPAP
jgi:hypothetical protein